MVKHFAIKSVLLAAVLAVIAEQSQLYPSRRVLNWIELCLDGMAPDWLARDAAKVTAQLWKETFRHCSKSSSSCFVNEIVNSVKNDLYGRSHVDFMELAAGSGVPPKLWTSAFEEAGLKTRTVLTDLQPNPASWQKLGLNYVNAPVDATTSSFDIAQEYPDWGSSKDTTMEVRMIHLALHHLQPETAQKVFQDAVNSKSILMVGDLAPTLGGVFLNGFLSFEMFLRVIFKEILFPAPLKMLLLPGLPVLMLGLWHDATVSVLRSYSLNELQNFLDQATANCTSMQKYRVETFQSLSYSELLGLPAILPSFQDPILQFFVAIPDYGDGSEDLVTVPHAIGTMKAALTGREQGNKFTPLTREYHAFCISIWILIFAAVGTRMCSFSSSKSPSHRKTGANEPSILAIGTAVPPYRWSQEQFTNWTYRASQMSDPAREFLNARVRNSGIDHRNSCQEMEVFVCDDNPSVLERHQLWAEWAPKLAIQAAKNALTKWKGHSKDEITHVIFHSCTGFKAPGIELDLVDALGLTNVRRRLGINYMGCFGGFTGMAVAKSFVQADPEANVLLVCVELCSIHFSFSEDRSKGLGNAIFSDGGAAVIIGAGSVGDWSIGEQRTRTMAKSTREHMTWTPGNSCYDMHLDKRIGLEFGKDIFFSLSNTLREMFGNALDDAEWCVHPGGKKLLDHFSSKRGIGISQSKLRHSYEVMRQYGNMSSPTIFFVFDQMMQEAKESTKPSKTAIGLGFGPGLTMEIVALHRIEATKSNES